MIKTAKSAVSQNRAKKLENMAWVALVSVTFVCRLVIAFAVTLSPPLSPRSSLPRSSLPRSSLPRSSLPRSLFHLQVSTIGGGLPPSIMGARRRNLRLARGSAESVCLCAHHYLHHVPPKLHTRPCTLTTPLHSTTLHSHLLPSHTVPPHRHLCLGY